MIENRRLKEVQKNPEDKTVSLQFRVPGILHDILTDTLTLNDIEPSENGFHVTPIRIEQAVIDQLTTTLHIDYDHTYRGSEVEVIFTSNPEKGHILFVNTILTHHNILHAILHLHHLRKENLYISQKMSMPDLEMMHKDDPAPLYEETLRYILDTYNRTN